MNKDGIEAMREVFNELFSHLERLETQNEAILQFLKEKKRVTDKQLAPYLEQAGDASNVRWLAARLRIEHLLAASGEESSSDKKTEKEQAATVPKNEKNKKDAAQDKLAEQESGPAEQEKEPPPVPASSKPAVSADANDTREEQPQPRVEKTTQEPQGPQQNSVDEKPSQAA